jgi:hypothetical protein
VVLDDRDREGLRQRWVPYGDALFCETGITGASDADADVPDA